MFIFEINLYYQLYIIFRFLFIVTIINDFMFSIEVHFFNEKKLLTLNLINFDFFINIMFIKNETHFLKN